MSYPYIYKEPTSPTVVYRDKSSCIIIIITMVYIGLIRYHHHHHHHYVLHDIAIIFYNVLPVYIYTKSPQVLVSRSPGGIYNMMITISIVLLLWLQYGSTFDGPCVQDCHKVPRYYHLTTVVIIHSFAVTWTISIIHFSHQKYLVVV